MALATLLSGVTSIGTGSAAKVTGGPKTVRLKVVGTGAVQATADIYGTDDEYAAGVLPTTGGVFIGTLSASGTTIAADGFAINAPWTNYYATLTSISGTAAAATVTVGG